MRWRSKETARKDRETEKLRKEYREKFSCGEIHEVLGGSQWRHITKKDPRFWIPVKDSFQHREIQYW